MRKYRLIWPAVFLALALAGGASAEVFPEEITPSVSPECLREGNDHDDWTGTSNIRHIAVDNTDGEGLYNVYVVFNDVLENPPYGFVNDAYYAEKTGGGNWAVYDFDELAIPWPGPETDDTRFGCLAADDNNNLYVAVRRSGYDKWVLATKNGSDVWAAEYISTVNITNIMQCDSMGLCLAAARNGDYLAFSSIINKYPQSIYAGSNSWLGPCWAGLSERPNLGSEWPKIMVGGYRYRSYGYWSSTCAVTEAGKTLTVCLNYHPNPLMPIYTGTDPTFKCGFDYALWDVGTGDFELARFPHVANADRAGHPNTYSIAPYAEEHNGNEIVHLVWKTGTAHNKGLYYSSYAFNSGSWCTPTLLEGVAPAVGLTNPQVTYYNTAAGGRYLMVTYEAPGPLTASRRIYLGMWELSDVSPPSALFTPFEVAPDLGWTEDPYDQRFPNVCVEKTSAGEDEFEINVLWTNCVWNYEHDPNYPESSDAYYRAFHYAPTQ